MIAIALAAVTVLATTLGGALALKSKDRFHLVLGLAAGLMLGLVSFDLLPEIFRNATLYVGKLPAVTLAFVGGFLTLHFFEQFAGSHEPVDSDYDHDHTHYGNIAGGLGALAMAGHVFLDGMALGLAFQVSNAFGIAVFIALIVHAFSDGLNTVAMLIKGGKWSSAVKALLVIDAIARISGAALGSKISISNSWLAIYLAIFSGFIIYIATSHILPEAHSRHPSRMTMVATLIGVLTMFLVVNTL
ncbi:MAG: ZIP family metal transporter [Actinomycetes bacterium]